VSRPAVSDRRMMVISSDGHATARMEDYTPYLDPEFREEFAAFCVEYREKGSHTFEEPAMRGRLDPYVVQEWVERMVEPGRIEGNFDPVRRLQELEGEGVVGEVIFPDFGLPFELYSPTLAAQLGYGARTQEQIDAGDRAYNRWLADFVSVAPERFAGMASLSFHDVDAAVAELHAIKAMGLKGVVIPAFDERMPLYAAEFDPIWSTIEDLELVLNSHVAISATSNRWVGASSPPPHPACLPSLFRGVVVFYCQQIVDHLIWGGVLERHPRLKVVFTEQGSAWFAGKMTELDYSWQGSYLRRDIREVVKRPPSEYFQRQCWIGSSLLSRAEVGFRQTIGLDKMMVGVDYPHHEGTWNGGTINYLQATFGPNDVPEDEARLMLGETAAKVFNFDPAALAPVVQRCGPTPQQILTPPTEDLFPRGDVNKPLSGATIF
jgi:predicted TIM-barrel fold metal-dependent hydrolase